MTLFSRICMTLVELCLYLRVEYEFSKKLRVQKAELKRGLERAELAEKNLKSGEDELETVGESTKQVEKLEREEKLVKKILSLQQRYKVTEARFEYGETNFTKLNQRFDDIEVEIYRKKLKIKKCSDELIGTFDDMLPNYWIVSETKTFLFVNSL